MHSQITFAHSFRDYGLFGLEKYMKCEGDLGTTYIKLEKNWFQESRIFQKEDGIWNELCLKDNQDKRKLKKRCNYHGRKV